MKARTWAVCLACGAVGLFLSSVSQTRLTGQEKAKEPGIVKWEYKLGVSSMDWLNESGNDGWELVTVDRGIPYLKRPKH